MGRIHISSLVHRVTTTAPQDIRILQYVQISQTNKIAEIHVLQEHSTAKYARTVTTRMLALCKTQIHFVQGRVP